VNNSTRSLVIYQYCIDTATYNSHRFVALITATYWISAPASVGHLAILANPAIFSSRQNFGWI